MDLLWMIHAPFREKMYWISMVAGVATFYELMWLMLEEEFGEKLRNWKTKRRAKT
jgi:hypothetical protein